MISWLSHSDLSVVFYQFVYRIVQKYILVHVFSKFSYLTSQKDLLLRHHGEASSRLLYLWASLFGLGSHAIVLAMRKTSQNFGERRHVGHRVTTLYFCSISFFFFICCWLLNSVISDPRSSVFVTCISNACQNFDPSVGSVDTHRIF